MNTTIRNLIVALPLATAALTMTPGVAQASDGPIIVQPTPDPTGPRDIANPTPDPVDPTGPGDLTAPQPCPTHGDCGGNGGNGGEDGGKGGDEPDVHNGGGLHPQGDVDSIALPTRIDAGLAPAQQDGATGLELSWLLASGALVTASGAAFAARRVRARA
jgi:hypothetical protein